VLLDDVLVREDAVMSDRNITSVNAPQRPRSRWGAIVIAAVAALALIALIAAVGSRTGQQAAASPSGTATAVSSPSSTSTAQSTTAQTASAAPATTSAAPTTATSSSTYQSPLGYSVQFGSPWRRSELQSRTSPPAQGDPDLLGTETFTTRTPTDEQAAIRATDTGVGPAQYYTANVALYRNSRNETAMAYAQRVKNGYGLIVVSVDPATVDGRAGAKTTFKFASSDTQTFYTLYVQDADRIWTIGYTLAPAGQPIPAGATEAGVRAIVESFKFAR